MGDAWLLTNEKLAQIESAALSVVDDEHRYRTGAGTPGEAQERYATIGGPSVVLRLARSLLAERTRRTEAEALLREVFEEFGPGCRDFSTWDTVERFLEHGLDQ